MKKLIIKILLLTTLILLVACASVEKASDSSLYVTNKVLLASGHSKLMVVPQLTQSQNQLATEQAAKLDAYRELAKQLYTEKLADGLVVAHQVMKDESYRIYLDLFLRQAEVVESNVFANQKRVVLELSLTPRFYQCFSTTVSAVSRCLQEDNKTPFTRIGYQQAPISTVNLSCVSSGCESQLHVSGFSREKTGINRALLNAGLYDAQWTINMAMKTAARYFFLSEVVFQ